MIRTYNISVVSVENGVAKNLATVFCDSNDTKPTSDLVNGSRLIEVDTGKCYLYDEEATDWVEVIRGGGGIRGEEATVSGEGEITLPNALAKHVKSLYQYGYIIQNSGTPSPSDPVYLRGNCGDIKFGSSAILGDKKSAWINTNNAWASDSGSYSYCVSVGKGKKVALSWTTTDSATVGTIFRFGFSHNNTANGQTLTQAQRTTPQDLPYIELTADKDYLVIQVSNSYGDSIANHGYLEVRWLDGIIPEYTSSEISLNGDAGVLVLPLYAVGDYRDEHETISGTIIRRVGIKYFDGTEDWQYSSTGHTFDWYDTSIQKSSVVGSQFVWCTHFRSADEAPAAANRDGYAILFNTTPTNRIGFGYDTANGDVAVWKAWLVEQYQKGTPVMVIYPLVTEVTETFDPQTLTLQSGNNVLKICTFWQDIDNDIELKCTYIKAAD